MSALVKRTISVSLPEADELTQLSTFTDVVCDTGDFESMKKFTPQDATTNPSLMLKAAIQPQYAALVDEAVQYACAKTTDAGERLNLAMDKVAVNFGVEITKIVPGYVSTEVDARLSFDTAATVAKGRSLIAMYKEMGVDKSRILIKIAATYEGIRAAEILEKEDGITCNLTLLFSMVQAVACADAKVTLISPFVGRIMDWHKAKASVGGGTPPAYVGTGDPGVASVMKIYNYFKVFGAKTIIMGASFRNKDEILSLAGCDKLTISPGLLEELSHSFGIVHRLLSPERSVEAAASAPLTRIATDEASFRWQLNQDAMATEKLAEGIRAFAADIEKLEVIMKAKFPSA